MPEGVTGKAAEVSVACMRVAWGRSVSYPVCAALAALCMFLVLSSSSQSRNAVRPSVAVTSSLELPQERRIGQRAIARVERLIQIAQKDRKSDDDSRKSFDSGPSLKKSTPSVKKSPPSIKKSTPSIKKSTPAIKKTAPVLKKTAPIQKAPIKKSPIKKAPIKEAPPPTKTAPIKTAPSKAETPPPQTGPSDEQLQENKDFCAQNPSSPKCGGTADQEPPPATEKICGANPKYPGCDDLAQPDLGAPKEDGQVGSICEQNPRLPQCQPSQETAQSDVPGGRPEEPEDQADDDDGPRLPPPTALEEGEPPPPPMEGEPPQTGEGIETPTTPPSIQNADDTCGQNQVAWGDQCVWPGNCPDGQVEYIDFSTDPPTYGVCGDTCPDGTLERAGGCIGTVPCSQQGGIAHDGQCLAACPEGLLQHNRSCVGECPPYAVQNGNMCETCPDGERPYGNECVATCDPGEIRVGGSCEDSTEVSLEDYLEECEAAFEAEYGMPPPPEACEHLVQQLCDDGYEAISGRPGSDYEMCRERSCPDGRENVNGACVCTEEFASVEGGCSNQCNSDEALWNGECVYVGPPCPDGQVHEDGTCVDACPEGMLESVGRCVGAGYCASVGGVNYNGECLDPDPENVCPGGQYYSGDGRCGDQCADGQPVLYGTNCYAQCPSYADEQACAVVETAPPAEGEQPPAEGEPPVAEGPEPGEGEPPVAEGPETPSDGEPPVAEVPPDQDEPPAKDYPPDGGKPPIIAWPFPPDIGRPPWPVIPEQVVQRPAPALAAQSESAPALPLAVVIFNSRYSASEVPHKPQAALGAYAFMDFLRDEMKLPRERLIQLRDLTLDGLEAFIGERGARTAQLKSALESARPSELIVYFAGHAMPVDGGKDAVLLAADGDPSKPEETGYRLSTLYANLKSFGVKRLRFYIDASFNRDLAALPVKNAADPWSVSVFPATEAVGTAARNWVVVTAAKGDQPAYAAPSKPMSAFAAALLEGLRGQADEGGAGNNDGMISAAELLDYVVPAVNAEVSQATGGEQSPTLHGRAQEVVRFLRGSAPAAVEQVATPKQPEEPAQKASAPSTPPAQPGQPSEFSDPPPQPGQPSEFSDPPPQPEQPSEFRQPPPQSEPQPAPEPEKEAETVKAVAPSFDCGAARTRGEKAICANPALAELDSRMASLSDARRAALQGAELNAFTAAQERWIGRRQACRGNAGCLTIIYRQWIETLQ